MNDLNCIQSFTLRGVHGYKDLSVQCFGKVLIIAADNGVGKTTLLNAMNAFLSIRFHRLAALSFTKIECKFTGYSDLVVLNYSDLGGVQFEDSDGLLSTLAASGSISEDDLVGFINNEYDKGYDNIKNHPILRNLYINTPGTHADLKQKLDALNARLKPFLNEEAKKVAKRVREAMVDINILYLPTYRRIERPLLRPAKRMASIPSGSVYINRDIEKKEYSYQGVTFGLADIEDRLTELSGNIERISNIGYRNSSAQILQDTLNLNNLNDVAESNLPDLSALSLFLGRIGSDANNLKNLIDNIERLYESDEIRRNAAYKLLRYFLARLNTVILETNYLEQMIQKFVRVCNDYLTMSNDEKSLDFDVKDLRVVVKNKWTNLVTGLDTLSSGEKQIVSLMAKLYLYEGKKFVLVDEPELSLSIDWQKKVLPDVMRSGSVVQMVAITHSPFIFDNELDQYAAPLIVERSQKESS